ncbi:DUF2147 domain-containing protein [Bradyrhizobium sp. sBnM-33]|uniref:DUF2147 domain-containing protein n=1 Tax=Bradyrhizobium sp. sBnM-33 TaxID=2831780 RepID=UPI001BD15970|nr:DUF2147 domain-containing protein [Bradyrhizobium sp. sBnM-33]WOH49500.1 DUF2147 domain-containing protein [Bradyrhizobium sp. sBnM-33]
MKQLCFLAVLMLLGSSAHAGISFKITGHRVHIESSRHCRSTSCASTSVSRSLNWRHKRDRHDDDRDGAMLAKPAPQTVSPPAPPAPPPKTITAAPPPALYTPAASMTQIVTAPPSPPAPAPAPPPAQQVSIPLPPPPPPAKPVETVQPARQVERVSHQAEEEPSDSPIGDWQTEGKGRVRIAKCGNALCGYALTSSSNEKGEAILINMKLKTERQWAGGVYSQDSGATYYGTISMKGINTLRVEACVLLRFYCSGNNWSRITRRADSLVMMSAEPRS